MRICSEYSELASAWIDGELDSLEEGELKEHLSVCASCRKEHSSLLLMKEASQSAVEAHKCPASLRAAISASLDAVEQPVTQTVPSPRFKWWQVSWAPAFAVAFMLIFLIGRPGYVPIHTLPSVLESAAYHLSNSPDDAAGALAQQTGLSILPVHLSSLGMRFENAGRADLDGCKAVFFVFGDQQGRKVTVYQFCPKGRALPNGEDLSRYGTPARHLKAVDGCNVLYWPQNDLVVAVCSDIPVEDLVDMGKLVADQLVVN